MSEQLIDDLQLWISEREGKQPIVAIKASKIIKESLGADFIVAPMNRTYGWCVA